MTPLRQRMIEDLQLRGMSERTQEMYVRAVHQLAAHYHKSPARITEEELRDYFPLSQACQALFTQCQYHRAVRHHVLLRAYPQAGMDHAALRAATPGTQAPSHPQPGGSAHAPPLCAVAALSCSASAPSMPVACGCRKAPTCRCPILIVPGWASTCATAKEHRIAMCPCHSRPWRCSASTGKLTATPCGFFRRRAGAVLG